LIDSRMSYDFEYICSPRSYENEYSPKYYSSLLVGDLGIAFELRYDIIASSTEACMTVSIVGVYALKRDISLLWIASEEEAYSVGNDDDLSDDSRNDSVCGAMF